MKKSFSYLLIITLFTALIWGILEKGKELVSQKTNIAEHVATIKNPTTETFLSQLTHSIKHPISLLFLQIILILTTARLFGTVFSKLGQPSVVGEIIAGIFLGPSIIGLLFPEFTRFVFPADSLKNLQFLSQIGLIFFMFMIGMELDLHKIKNKAKDAFVISHSSIIFPFFLGVLLSYFIYEKFAPANISFLVFSLFMGIAMSITAFPVLARIVQERGLTKTPLGVMVISCAAADDITAWCILAVVIAIAKAGTVTSALYTIVPAIVYIALMLYVVRPWLRKFITLSGKAETLDKTLVTVTFFVLLVSSYIAEVIGIHLLFGAFLAGTIMPQSIKIKTLLTEKIEDVSVIVFLPVFFAVTGLRTQIGLLNEGRLWITCLSVVSVAVVGKFGGSAFAARLVGQSWKDSLSIGALMNTRGLMELIVLNIGYDLGILSPEIFAIMVLMAVATTFMTGPLLDLIKYLFFKSATSARVENAIKHKRTGLV